MILKNIKDKQKGFTIVELLVVIVVIGILAAITVVSYTGITQKANTTKALSNAQSVQNIGEIYAAENTYYPTTITAFNGGSVTAKLPSGVTVVAGVATTPTTPATDPLAALATAALRTTTVTYVCSGGTAAAGNCAGNTGGKITFWDFSTNAVSTTILYLGDAKSTSTFFTPAA